MPTFPLMQVDAFTDVPLGGNPCAVVFDADPLDDAMRLAIAREMNLSETAFVVRSDVADFGARYFTPAEEIPLAGHPTIATVFALAESGRLALRGDVTTITLELKVGPIQVDVEAVNGRVARVVMTQLAPRFLATYAPEQVMPVFGLSAEDILPDAPLQTVSTGTPQLMIPVKNLDVLRRVQLDIPAYATLRGSGDFFSAHLFCLEGVTAVGDTFARHFVVPPDLVEDPFTGSATGGMGAYLWHYGLIASPRFTAEQGHWMERPGQASVEVLGPADAITGVRVGGGAVTVLRGDLVV
ncbi:MAG: PhzF family phenazine biosynthesis protein [Anaerolineaceae bacterium]|nr:PhzF family phenazine biosynthesis protein [Anaerolineaceae bacterium]